MRQAETFQVKPSFICTKTAVKVKLILCEKFSTSVIVYHVLTNVVRLNVYIRNI